ncbi:hypothetical protein [Marivita geojedonensis]|uniref:Uncharacterized protein n=1 Tax=Marivita geojedonensis TaxID=1123756 RepID=A0A1X4NNA1_9RHOB|nr:hypothetical protein [Marivita geojedonensis]OSQ52029.1 hypothetical protein MGEO_05715 [Marivita geojedonensis]PRY81213.1 hypothetical protein CLV76_102175 [Marivita geojedonensis]
MPGWVWFVPLGLATLVGALLAFRYGWIAATITETDVINAIATRYVTQDGGSTAQVGDCVGLAGQVEGAWITVKCNDLVYHVTRFGRLMSTEGQTLPEGPSI